MRRDIVARVNGHRTLWLDRQLHVRFIFAVQEMLDAMWRGAGPTPTAHEWFIIRDLLGVLAVGERLPRRRRR